MTAIEFVRKVAALKSVGAAYSFLPMRDLIDEAQEISAASSESDDGDGSASSVQDAVCGFSHAPDGLKFDDD